MRLIGAILLAGGSALYPRWVPREHNPSDRAFCSIHHGRSNGIAAGDMTGSAPLRGASDLRMEVRAADELPAWQRPPPCLEREDPEGARESLRCVSSKPRAEDCRAGSQAASAADKIQAEQGSAKKRYRLPGRKLILRARGTIPASSGGLREAVQGVQALLFRRLASSLCRPVCCQTSWNISMSCSSKVFLTKTWKSWWQQ